MRVLLIRKLHFPCETTFAYRSSSACWRKKSLLVLARSHRAQNLECKNLKKSQTDIHCPAAWHFPGPDVLHPQNTSDPLNPLPYIVDAGLNDALFTVP